MKVKSFLIQKTNSEYKSDFVCTAQLFKRKMFRRANNTQFNVGVTGNVKTTRALPRSMSTTST